MVATAWQNTLPDGTPGNTPAATDRCQWARWVRGRGTGSSSTKTSTRSL
jgi:hypothetical protein